MPVLLDPSSSPTCSTPGSIASKTPAERPQPKSSQHGRRSDDPKRNTVRFKVTEVSYVESNVGIPPVSTCHLYYSKVEYAVMKLTNDMIIRRVEENPPLNDESDLCLRGLENQTRVASETRSIDRVRCVRQILREQDRQRAEGICDPDIIAKTYRKLSSQDKIRAEYFGFTDAMKAQEILQESPEVSSIFWPSSVASIHQNNSGIRKRKSMLSASVDISRIQDIASDKISSDDDSEEESSWGESNNEKGRDGGDDVKSVLNTARTPLAIFHRIVRVKLYSARWPRQVRKVCTSKANGEVAVTH
jgi:hypothetical protein